MKSIWKRLTGISAGSRAAGRPSATTPPETDAAAFEHLEPRLLLSASLLETEGAALLIDGADAGAIEQPLLGGGFDLGDFGDWWDPAWDLDVVPPPDTPDGPDTGLVCEELSYTTEGTDPLDIHDYKFDWGDGDVGSWESRETTQSHTYDTPGTYYIRAKEKCPLDIFETDWSNPKEVVISAVAGTEPADVTSSDLDGDGSEDLWRRDGSGQWVVTTAQGSDAVWGMWSTAVEWQDVQAANVNGDAYADLVGRVTSTGEWWAAVSDGSSFTNKYMGAWSPITWNDVHAGDIDGDGNADVIGRTDGGNWWAAMSNGTSFTSQYMGSWAPITWNDVQAADVNGDGNTDVVGRTDGGQWWAGVSNGTSFTNQHMGAWSPVAWSDVQAADVNGDGNADVVGRVTSTGDWWAAVSNGTTFTNQRMGAWSPIAWSDVQAADVNGDGNVDVIGRVTSTGDWWAAVSNGTTFTNQQMGTWSPSVTWGGVRVVDLDGDGDDDVLGCVLTTDNWWAGVSDGASLTNVSWT